jgi:hypothetical protein
MLPQRLLLQADAMHRPLLRRWLRRLLLQADTLHGALLRRLLRRLLLQTDAMHLAMLHSAGGNLRPAVRCRPMLREAVR